MNHKLDRAYSSQLHIEHRQSGDVVIKIAPERERKNEIFFHEEMKKHHFDYFEMTEEDNHLVIEYIDDAETLQDIKSKENYRRFGEAVKNIHSIKAEHPSYMDQSGDEIGIDWTDFVLSRLNLAKSKQQLPGGFDQKTVDEITASISKSELLSPDSIVLLHGDLHVNNVIFKNDRVVVFDKADQILFGEPMYDLALIVINLSGAVYGTGQKIESDKQFLRAFIEGYGTDFTTDMRKLDVYVLLRALERWPNPFEKNIPAIVAAILNK